MNVKKGRLGLFISQRLPSFLHPQQVCGETEIKDDAKIVLCLLLQWQKVTEKKESPKKGVLIQLNAKSSM